MNLAEIIDDHAPDSTALILNNRATTYGELRSQVEHFRGGLASLGVGDGDRVALVLTNGVPFVVAYLAALGLGAAVVPLNPTSPAPELAQQIATVGATLVVIDRSCTATWANVDAAAVPTVTGVVTTDPAAAGDSELIPFERLLESEPVERLDVDADHLAVLLFTSGTAGAPRAAMLTHGNLRANIAQSMSAEGHMNGDDVVYCVLPVFHIFGLNVVLGLALTVGATVVLVAAVRPDHRGRSRSPTAASPSSPARPGMWGAFTQLDDVPRRRLLHGPARTLGCGTSPAARSARRCSSGSASRCSRATGSPRRRRPSPPRPAAPLRPGSVGRSLEGVEVRLVEQQRRRRPRGRCRRGVGAGRQRVRRLPRRPQGHGGGAHRRRLAADRRHGDRGRRRLPVPRRSGEGPDDRVGVQRVPGRGRGDAGRPTRTSSRWEWSVCPIRTPAKR